MSFKRRLKRQSLKRRRIALTSNGLVPMSSQVIEKLVKQGWSRSKLLEYKAMGCKYNPELGTIWSDWQSVDSFKAPNIPVHSVTYL